MTVRSLAGAGATFIHDRHDRLDYQFNFATSFLAASETITAYELIVSTHVEVVDEVPGDVDDVTVENDDETDGLVVFWVDGVADAVEDGELVTITCRITTSAGREKDEVIGLYITGT